MCAYPYSEDALHRLHPDGWADIPTRELLAHDLTPTQPALAVDRILHHLAGGEPETGDHALHVVSHGGRLYVHDGHHRWAIACARGASLPARVVNELGQVS